MAHKDDIPFVLLGADGIWLSAKIGNHTVAGPEAREMQKEIEARGGLDKKATVANAVNDPRLPFQPDQDHPWLPAFGRQSRPSVQELPREMKSIYENGAQPEVIQAPKKRRRRK